MKRIQKTTAMIHQNHVQNVAATMSPSMCTPTTNGHDVLRCSHRCLPDKSTHGRATLLSPAR